MISSSSELYERIPSANTLKGNEPISSTKHNIADMILFQLVYLVMRNFLSGFLFHYNLAVFNNDIIDRIKFAILDSIGFVGNLDVVFSCIGCAVNCEFEG